MPKNIRKFRDFEYDEELNENRNHPGDIRERRKMKRMKNALRTLNVDELLDDSY